jgi:hypothetical protein
MVMNGKIDRDLSADPVTDVRQGYFPAEGIAAKGRSDEERLSCRRIISNWANLPIPPMTCRVFASHGRVPVFQKGRQLRIFAGSFAVLLRAMGILPGWSAVTTAENTTRWAVITGNEDRGTVQASSKAKAADD